MSGAFGFAYASVYDALYAEKDYDAECDLLEKVFASSGRNVRTVLDLGCGTGAHVMRLAARGYDVVGVDISEAMLDAARQRPVHPGSGSIEYLRGDIRTVRLDRKFDAVICMFAVLGYQTQDAEVSQALDTVRWHLVEGGPFVFDVWYGPAVESIGPSTRTKLVMGDDAAIERQASGDLDTKSHVCTVTYRLIRRRAGQPEEVTQEVHRMRYFFQHELERLTSEARLSLRDLLPFPDTAASLSASSWNVIAIARG